MIVLKTNKIPFKKHRFKKQRFFKDYVLTQLYCHARRIENMKASNYISVKAIEAQLREASIFQPQSNLLIMITPNGLSRLTAILDIKNKNKYVKENNLTVVSNKYMNDNEIIIVNVPYCEKVGCLAVNNRLKSFDFRIYNKETIYSILI